MCWARLKVLPRTATVAALNPLFGILVKSFLIAPIAVSILLSFIIIFLEGDLVRVLSFPDTLGCSSLAELFGNDKIDAEGACRFLLANLLC